MEVGAGTGTVLNALAREYPILPFGLDIDRTGLTFAREREPAFQCVQGEGSSLPFHKDCFQAAYCHYLLLWVADPLQILLEMKRVTQPGHAVIALAEPDHQARVDYPPPLDELGSLQTQALAAQGAEPTLGRRLRSLFHSAGLVDVEAGLLGARWAQETNQPEETEWMTLRSDLAHWLSEEQLDHYQQVDQNAYETGQRVLFIPTFFAMGRVER